MSKLMRCRVVFAALGIFACCVAAHAASPLVQPGDYRFRHDIRLLRDAGLLSGPVSTWPVSLPQLHRELARHDSSSTELPDHVAVALARVQYRLRMARAKGAGAEVSLRGGSEPQFIRSFADTPRGRAEASVGLDWTGDTFAGELQLTRVKDDPKDDQDTRLDGSWFGGIWGDWLIAGGAIQRYWGPGWQGGLILSDNARPRPGVTLRRMSAERFDSKWLSWIGPWHLTTFVEKLEHDRARPDALLWGMRFAFTPLETLEIGLSRTAQFGGDGNELNFGTIVDMVSGRSNAGGEGPTIAGGEDINQLAGLDFRWRLPWVNAALLGEFIGEDAKSNRPFKTIGQGGVELWGGFPGGGPASWRFIFERTNTKANVFREAEDALHPITDGIAYNNGSFPTGYRYRDRVLGHPIESDALVNSMRLLVDLADGSFLNLAFLDGNLNRTERNQALKRRNTLTTRNEDVQQIEMSWRKQYRIGQLELGLGRTTRKPVSTGVKSTDTFGWLGFNRRF